MMKFTIITQELHHNFISLIKENYAKQTLYDKGVNIWNKLDCNYKNIKSYTTFKKKIKKHLLLNN